MHPLAGETAGSNFLFNEKCGSGRYLPKQDLPRPAGRKFVAAVASDRSRRLRRSSARSATSRGLMGGARPGQRRGRTSWPWRQPARTGPDTWASRHAGAGRSGPAPGDLGHRTATNPHWIMTVGRARAPGRKLARGPEDRADSGKRPAKRGCAMPIRRQDGGAQIWPCHAPAIIAAPRDLPAAGRGSGGRINDHPRRQRPAPGIVARRGETAKGRLQSEGSEPGPDGIGRRPNDVRRYRSPDHPKGLGQSSALIA